ncbi:hypothetical protein IAD21_05738 [Abditibacteriota bacterium]|nr:hypothetical protein IAD21_05738 [Abditibacteriota bacterium]
MTAQQRKAFSEAFLKSKRISVDSQLAPIEADLRSRSIEEIARRAMCLTLVALKAEGMNDEEVAEFQREHAIETHLTRVEKRFLGQKSSDDDGEWVWRFEALHVLLWALGYVVALGFPDAESDAGSELEFLRDLGPQGFIEGALLRSNEQILDAADWVFRLHQSVVDERAGTEELTEEVVEQWSVAFDWLTREEENWE